MERQAADFYTRARPAPGDAATRKLLGDLAAAEAGHERHAAALQDSHLGDDARAEEDSTARRQFILTWVQPGLAGLMDGSVDAGADLCHRLCHARHLDDLSGRPGGLGRGRHLDGLHRSRA
jgi:rubrerythrin